MNAEMYTKPLEDVLIPYLEKTHGSNFKFQQDSVPVHESKLTKEWLITKNISESDWLSLSLDRNPMENLWDILPRKVYNNNRQFQNLMTKKIILHSLSEIDNRF